METGCRVVEVVLVKIATHGDEALIIYEKAPRTLEISTGGFWGTRIQEPGVQA